MKISAKYYAQALYELTDGKSKSEVETLVAEFAKHLARSRNLKLSEKIIGQFSGIYDKEKGIIEAEITTSEKLLEPMEKKIIEYVRKKYHVNVARINNIIDKKIKGGVIVKVGDAVMDGSVKGRLNRLRKELAT